MKKYFLLPLSLLFLFQLNVSAQVTWETFIPSNPHKAERFIKSMITPDNQLLSVGLSMNDNGLNDFYLVLQNADTGDLVWEKTYDFGGEERLSAIAIATDGFVIAGRSYPDENSYSQAVIIKFDYEGEKIWEQSFSSDFHSGINSVVVTSSGTIFAGGTQRSLPLTQANSPLLVKISADGGLVDFINQPIPGVNLRDYIRLFISPTGELFANLATDEENIFVQLNAENASFLTNYEVTNDLTVVEKMVFKDNDFYCLLQHDRFTGDHIINKYSLTGDLLAQSPSQYINGFHHDIMLNNNELTFEYYKDFPSPTAVVKDVLDTNDLGLLSSSESEVNLEDINVNHVFNVDGGFYYSGTTTNNTQLDAKIKKFKSNITLDWENTFGINNDAHTEVGSSIIQDKDGGYIFHYMKTLATGTVWAIGKINEAGELSDEIIYDDNQGSGTNFNKLLQAEDGTIYLLFHNSPAAGICKINTAGTVEWVNEVVAFTPRSFKGGLCELPNGNIAVSIPVFGGQITNNRPSNLIIYSPSGSIVSETLLRPEYESYETKDMIVTSDNHLAIAGYLREEDEPGVKGFLTKYTLDGTMVWESILPDTLDAFLTISYALAENSQGHIITNGFLNSAEGASPIYASYNLDGSNNYINIGDDEAAVFDVRNYGIAITPADENFTAGAKFPILDEPVAGFSGTRSNWISKTDIDGNLIFSYSFQVGGNSALFDACPSPEGGLVVIGNRNKSQSDDTYLIKIGADGISSTPLPLIRPFEIQVYPNPTTDIINISFDQTLKQAVTLSVLNTQGQVLQAQNLPAGNISTTINMNALTPGIYFVEIFDGKYRVVRNVMKH